MVHTLPLVLCPQVISQPAVCSLWVASAGKEKQFQSVLVRDKAEEICGKYLLPDAIGSCLLNLLSDLLSPIFLICKWLDHGLGLYVEGEGGRGREGEGGGGGEKLGGERREKEVQELHFG